MDRHDFLNEVVDEAMELFNDRFKTEYSRERIFIKYVNAHNGDKLIPQFIDEYFPDVKEEEFCVPGLLYEIDLDFIENVGAVFLRIKTDILTKNM